MASSGRASPTRIQAHAAAASAAPPSSLVTAQASSTGYIGSLLAGTVGGGSVFNVDQAGTISGSTLGLTGGSISSPSLNLPSGTASTTPTITNGTATPLPTSPTPVTWLFVEIGGVIRRIPAW